MLLQQTNGHVLAFVTVDYKLMDAGILTGVL